MKKIMKKLESLVFLVYLVVLGGSLNAQTDSVWMEGRVTDATSGKPQTACEVQMLQEGEAKAITFCDEEGYFTIGWTPVGTYTLSILSEGTSLYYAEIKLTESAMVNIALMPDTVDLRALEAVEVTGIKHKLGGELITSPDDTRLWNFNGIWELMCAGPASADLSWNTPNGRNPQWASHHLRSWRPAWLDAPWTVKRKKEKTEKP